MTSGEVYTARDGGNPRSPRVSVILPTFNRLEFLRGAVDSVRAQSFEDWEMVIADDGSDGTTRDWLRRVERDRVRVLWLEHCGNPARVRNSALALARGEFVAFLDSDDLWARDKLAKQLRALEQSTARWSYTACDRIDAQDRRIAAGGMRPPGDGDVLVPLLALSAGIAMPTVMAERRLLKEIGGFDERQRFGEFHDLCLRLALRARAIGIPEVLCSVRAHDRHFSANRVAAHADWMRLYAKMATLMPEAPLRALCLRMRARMALDVARGQASRRDAGAATRALRDGAVFSWRYARLWPGAMLALLRARMPGA